MNLKRILFVEDKTTDYTLFKDAVSAWNEENSPREFVIVNATNVEDAEQQLSSTLIDCALFDLKLPISETDKNSSVAGGSGLAHAGLQDNGIPVGIISGDPADIDPTLQKLGPVRVFNKGDLDAQEQAVAWFGDQWRMMEVLAGVRRQIRRSGADVFARRVWPRWEAFGEIGAGENEALEKIVTRQYAGHIAEVLGVENGENADWHPIEAYINPALQEDRPHTGDLFKFDDGLWVVLSPQCDMATKKAKRVLIAFCDPAALPEWKERVAEFAGDPSAKVKISRDKFFAKLVNQASAYQHFLPPLENDVPLMVDFRDVKSIVLADLEAALENRVASISPPFLSNLIQRFGSYVTRTGQPNIDVKYFG